jgi:chromosome segregation ATPase
MIRSLTEPEQDYAYSQGFLETWLKDAPKQVKEHLQVLVDGISAYREKYISIQEDYKQLQDNYNRLTATSAQYLEFMRQQKEQIDQALIDQQRPFHKSGEPPPYIET